MIIYIFYIKSKIKDLESYLSSRSLSNVFVNPTRHFSIHDSSQNKSQSDDHEMKQELKKTQSKLQNFEHKMKTMEEELSKKNKELENTKAEISSMSKKLETKQNDKSLNKHAGGDKNKAEEPTTDASTQVTSSSDKSKQKIASLENKVLSKRITKNL